MFDKVKEVNQFSFLNIFKIKTKSSFFPFFLMKNPISKVKKKLAKKKKKLDQNIIFSFLANSQINKKRKEKRKNLIRLNLKKKNIKRN